MHIFKSLKRICKKCIFCVIISHLVHYAVCETCTHTRTHTHLCEESHLHSVSPSIVRTCQIILTSQKCPNSADEVYFCPHCFLCMFKNTHTYTHTHTHSPCLLVFVSCRIIPDVNYCLILVSEVNLIKVLNWTWTSSYKKERQSLLNIIIKSSPQFKAKQKMTLLLACLLILYAIPKLLWGSPDNGWSRWKTFVSKAGIY